MAVLYILMEEMVPQEGEVVVAEVFELLEGRELPGKATTEVMV